MAKNNMENEEAKKAKETLKGMVRGVVFETDRNYIVLNYGDEGLKKVELWLKNIGEPINYRTINRNKWYPAYLRLLSILAVKNVFSLSEEEIRKMGELAPKASKIVRLFFKFFVPIKKFAKEIPGFWQKHWTNGKLIVEVADGDKKELVVSLVDFGFCPLLSIYLEGYFETVIKLSRPKDSVVKAESINCAQKEGRCYKYIIKWT